MEANSWQDCGFPDISFRLGYLPWIGLVKALNERLAVAKFSLLPVPEYFTPRRDMMFYCNSFDEKLIPMTLSSVFVNPDKIPSASSWTDCFWDFSDLILAAAGGVEEDTIFSFDSSDWLYPEFSVKWALQRYNAINLLRYVVTEIIYVPPYVEYEDINDTFQFKA